MKHNQVHTRGSKKSRLRNLLTGTAIAALTGFMGFPQLGTVSEEAYCNGLLTQAEQTIPTIMDNITASRIMNPSHVLKDCISSKDDCQDLFVNVPAPGGLKYFVTFDGVDSDPSICMESLACRGWTSYFEDGQLQGRNQQDSCQRYYAMKRVVT